MNLCKNQNITSNFILTETPRVLRSPVLFLSLILFLNDALQNIVRSVFSTCSNICLVYALSARLTSYDLDNLFRVNINYNRLPEGEELLNNG